MSHISLTRNDAYAILRLNRGKSSPINHDMVRELRSELRNILEDGLVKGLIITGNKDFFSVGLDLPELYGYNEEAFAAFWKDFLGLIGDMVAFDKPLIAAVTGHAPAGGCILAIGCDYRIMAEGNYKIGLNEIPVGLVVPQAIFEVYSFWIGSRLAYQYLMEGKLYPPQHAQAIGLIDEVVDGDAVLAAAETKMRQYLQFNENGWRVTKRQLRQNLVRSVASVPDADLNVFQAQWWSPEVRAMMEQFAENLKKK